MDKTESRRLEVQCGVKKQGDSKRNYVHMLKWVSRQSGIFESRTDIHRSGTLCATERALCCVVENYQTPDGLTIPEPLRPYMQGRDFLPFTRELPKGTTSQQKKK